MKSFLFAALAMTMIACGAPAGSRMAPTLVLRGLDGKPADFAAYRGKPVLVNFWATWCPTCREEMPALQEMYGRNVGKFALIGVSLDDEPAKVVPPFAQANKITFPLFVSDRPSLNEWAVRGLPTTFLLDADGRIVKRWMGGLDASAVENDILALLNRRPS